jgi:hypothetical protein
VKTSKKSAQHGVDQSVHILEEAAIVDRWRDRRIRAGCQASIS